MAINMSVKEILTMDNEQEEELRVTSKSEGGGEFGFGLIASSFLLIICLVCNIQCIRIIRRGKLRIMNGIHHDCDSNVVDLVSVICVVSLINGSCTCLTQILSFIAGEWSFGHHLCKAHGFATNLMSFLVIWYTTLLAIERYLKLMNPTEHSMTFSRINLQIIVFGIAFIILSVVSGPIYGWGDYTYLHAVRTCTFNVTARNAISYYIMTSTIYLLFPYIVMVGCCASVSFSGLNLFFRGSALNNPASSSSSSTFDEQRCDRYHSKKFVWPLVLNVIVSFLLQSPTHVTSIGQLLRYDWTFNSCLLFAAAWLQIFAINCCLASSILICNLRCSSCFSGDVVRCSPWWKIPVATECPNLNNGVETKEKRKNASYTCKLCLQLHIINGQ